MEKSMKNQLILEKIEKIKIVPVVALENAKDAKALGQALCDGGLPCAEITFRTEAAEESIRIMSEQFPDMLVGAGTVLTIEQAERAIKAGAKFLVSPGINRKVVDYCVENGILIIPGCATPSEVEQAIEAGLSTVKFFPAEAAGGLAMIKAMSGPYGKIKFMPTGGINMKNINEYLSFAPIIACGGSWMVSKEMIESGNFEQIEADTRAAVEHVIGR